MTLKQFRKLQIGDEITNIRGPGVILKVTNRRWREDGGLLELELNGKTWTNDLRASEYQQAYKQTGLPL